MNRNLQTLLDTTEKRAGGVHPVLLTRTKNMIRLAFENCNMDFAGFSGLRTMEEQRKLYNQGRTTPGKIVTKAKPGRSWHNFGLAIDLVEDGDLNKRGIQWSWANTADYKKLGRFAKEVGLEWGGFWKSFKDYPHVQLTVGMSLAQANELYSTGGIELVWNYVDNFTDPLPISDILRR